MKTRMTRDWNYTGYWNVVLGAGRTPGDVVREFALVEAGLDEWLGVAESESWVQGRLGGPMPESWAAFHGKALAELAAAIEEMDAHACPSDARVE